MTTQISFLSFSQGHLQELVDRARGGETAAFSRLSSIISDIAKEYFISKYRIGKIRTREDAEDLAQNVHLSFNTQFAKIESVERWLRKVLFYTFVTHYKRAKNQQVRADETAVGKKVTVDQVEEKLDMQKVLAILSTLGEEKQLVIKYRFWDGMKFDDIAGMMKKKPDAVKKIFYRTLGEIKKMM